jgi:hypothetical protein
MPGGRTETAGPEQIIPVVKEELEVGKRAAERRYRIRTYVVESPVEQQVNLRDERTFPICRNVEPIVGSGLFWVSW